MFAFNRVSRNGMVYHLSELPDGRTRIWIMEDGIIVPYSIHDLSRSWFDWTIRRINIQDAFHYLSAGEREFLQSGYTVEQWNKIFPPDMKETEE